MSDGMKVRLISAEQTHDLRHKILRPNQTRDHCSFSGDDAPETVHFGAFKNDSLLGIASLYKENHPDLESGVGWRLRGMATDPDVRGQGYGRTLLLHIVLHVRENEGGLLWCNARSTASEFYTRLHFRIIGEEFELPEIGPHYLMVFRVEPPPTLESFIQS